MEPEFLFIGSQSVVTCVFMNNNDLYSGDIDGNIIKWNYVSRRPEIKCKAHDKLILKIEYLQTVNQIISHSRDGFLKFWKILGNNFSEIGKMESNPFSFCGIALYHSMNFEFICNPLHDSDNTIEIIEYPRNIITHHIYAIPSKSSPDNNYGMVMCITVACEDTLLVAYESGYIVMFKQFKCCANIQVADCVISIAANKNSAIVGTPNNELIVLNIDDNQAEKLIEKKRIPLKNPGISLITFRNDGKIFATAGWDGFIRVFSAKKYKQLTVIRWNINNLPLDNTHQLSLCFNDDNYLISGSDDKIICFWNIYRS